MADCDNCRNYLLPLGEGGAKRRMRAGVGAVVLVVLWTMIPAVPTLDLFTLTGTLLPVCAGLALMGAAWVGVRVYSELKS